MLLADMTTEECVETTCIALICVVIICWINR